MITTPGSRKKLYADSTLIEQGVQKPLSVLGTDFMRYVLNTMTGPVGGDALDVDGGAFTAGGRYYMNLSRGVQTFFLDDVAISRVRSGAIAQHKC